MLPKYIGCTNDCGGGRQGGTQDQFGPKSILTEYQGFQDIGNKKQTKGRCMRQGQRTWPTRSCLPDQTTGWGPLQPSKIPLHQITANTSQLGSCRRLPTCSKSTSATSSWRSFQPASISPTWTSDWGRLSRRCLEELYRASRLWEASAGAATSLMCPWWGRTDRQRRASTQKMCMTQYDQSTTDDYRKKCHVSSWKWRTYHPKYVGLLGSI